MTGVNSTHWGGDTVGYAAFHLRVRKLRGSADHCSKCGANDPGGRYEWANLTGNYADPYDYEPMCVPCHRRFDIDLFTWGEDHPNAKLTEEIVREARRRYAAGDGDAASMAREYGVIQATMYRAIMGITWKRVA